MAAQTELQMEVQTVHSLTAQIPPQEAVTEPSATLLTDTNQTRTIYRNSDGHPLVITPDGNGNWVDFDGNTYRFVNNEDVYDQNDVDYYWHGEGADVYYMPVQ